MLGDDLENAVPLQSYELALLSRAASDAVTLAPWHLGDSWGFTMCQTEVVG